MHRIDCLNRLNPFDLSGLVVRAVLASGALALAACASSTRSPVPPPGAMTLPAPLQAQPNETLEDVLVTLGDETWRCAREPSLSEHTVPSDSTLRWVEVGSAGTLVDRMRRNVGEVLPGGYFVAYDGSFAHAAAIRESQVRANTLTWARYRVRSEAGARPASGRFANLSSIVRVETTGGLPPNPACTDEGLHLLVPYRATYLLYRASSVPAQQ